jgi:hypothetical protein
MGSVTVITMRQLGPTPQAAVRTLLTEFRYRGWKDSGNVALAIVRALEAADGALPITRAAKAAPDEFLTQNEIRRRELEQMFEQLAAQRNQG